MSLGLALYRSFGGFLEPLAPLLLARRARAGKEEAARLHERLGRPKLPRPLGRLAWLHGASVGESLSLLPLIAALRAERPGLALLVTSGTVASAEMMAKRLPARVLHQYAPVDAPGSARRFVAHWRPDLVVFVESELWPNLILEAEASGARLALLSARMSEASLKRWRRAPGAAKRLVRAFSLVQAQDETTARGIVALGGRDDGRLNLKAAADPLPTDEVALAAAREAAGGRPILLAASTHPGEDEMALQAFTPLQGRPDRPILVIVPRHPVRGPTVAELAAQHGLRARRQGAGQPFDGQAEVHVADGLGELGMWFRLAKAALVAGSLLPDIGGHNPLEPALLGCPVISGRNVVNWAALYGELDGEGLIAWAEDAPSLYSAFKAALDGDPTVSARAERARLYAESLRGQAAASARRLLALLP